MGQKALISVVIGAIILMMCVLICVIYCVTAWLFTPFIGHFLQLGFVLGILLLVLGTIGMYGNKERLDGMDVGKIVDIFFTVVGAIFIIIGLVTGDMMLVAIGIVWAIILPDWSV